MTRWTLVFVAALLCLPLKAQERTYAIMSLVGDSLLIVHRDMATGSRLDKNVRDVIAIPNSALDNAMVLALDDAVKAHGRGARTVLLGARDPKLFELQARALEEGSVLPAVLPVVRPLTEKSGATHLILAVKHRDEARVRMADGSVGSGWLQGLGFYLDHNMQVRNVSTGERTQGFIAPFVFFRLALVELATGKVLAEEIVRESTSVANQKAVGAWDALTAEQKVRILNQLVRRETQRALPELLDK